MLSDNDYHYSPVVLDLVSFAKYADSQFNAMTSSHYIISQRKNDVQSYSHQHDRDGRTAHIL